MNGSTRLSTFPCDNATRPHSLDCVLALLPPAGLLGGLGPSQRPPRLNFASRPRCAWRADFGEIVKEKGLVRRLQEPAERDWETVKTGKSLMSSLPRG